MQEWDFEHWGIKYWSKTKEFLEYEKKMFQNSEIRTDATASEANVKDKIVTLSTCTGNQATRFVVQGKRVNAVNPQ